MKKLILFTFFTSTVFAQTQKGSFTVGTQLSQGTFQFEDYFRSRTFNFSPNVGYFIINNLNVGIQTNLGLSSGKAIDMSNTFNYRFNSYSLMPYFTYFIGKNKLKPFVGASVGFGNSTIKERSQTTNSSQSTYGFYGGLSYFINPNISLNTALNYSNIKYKKFNSTQSTSLTFGFQLFFPKK
jgi:outer membrane protein